MVFVLFYSISLFLFRLDIAMSSMSQVLSSTVSSQLLSSVSEFFISGIVFLNSRSSIWFLFLFIYLFLAALGLRCYVRAFSSCGERGLHFVGLCGLLIVVASLVFPALAGRFLTTAPPGKPLVPFYIFHFLPPHVHIFL